MGDLASVIETTKKELDSLLYTKARLDALGSSVPLHVSNSIRILELRVQALAELKPEDKLPPYARNLF